MYSIISDYTKVFFGLHESILNSRLGIRKSLPVNIHALLYRIQTIRNVSEIETSIEMVKVLANLFING